MAMGFGTKKILAIDWDKKDLRLALVRTRGGGIELLKAVSVPIPPELSHEDAESFGAFLREAIRQSRISAKNAIMSVPREQVVLNTLRLPPTPVEELAALVQFQIVKELPFSADQATIDFAVSADHDSAAPCTALVAAIRNDDLSFYRDVAREAGLSLDQLGLRPYANLTAVLAGLPETRDQSMLIVEVGPQLTEIDIVKAGSLTFSRAASVPLPEFTPTPEENIKDSRIAKIAIQDIEPNETSRQTVERLMVDVIRSFEAYRATDATLSIDQIVICGATGVEMELAESLAARFATRSRLFVPEKGLDLSPQRARELRGFSAVLGLAMGQEQPQLEAFDFLKPKKPISKRTLRMKKAPAAIMTSILILGSGFLFHNKFVTPAKEKAEKVRKRVEGMQEREKPIKQFKARVEALRDWQRSEQVWPDVLLALTRVFPDEQEAFVSRIVFDTRARGKETIRTSTVRMNMQVSDLGKVNEVGRALRKINYQEVKEGQETRMGMVPPDYPYQFDTSIKAELPLRTLPEKKKADVPDPEGPDGPSEEALRDPEAGTDDTPSDSRKPASSDSGSDHPSSETPAASGGPSQ
ncbi:MAG: pilus assembly protein PilM [Phycisphaerae bacterium]